MKFLIGLGILALSAALLLLFLRELPEPGVVGDGNGRSASRPTGALPKSSELVSDLNPAEQRTAEPEQQPSTTAEPLEPTTVQEATFVPGPTTEPEREEWVRERRWEYFLGSRDFIRKHLGMLATAESEERLFGTAKALSRVNIATILGMRGREEYMKSGVKYSMNPSEEGNYVFGVNYWRYEFHRSEFPEFEYFFREQYRDDATGRIELPGVDPDVLNRVILRSEEALGFFPEEESGE